MISMVVREIEFNQSRTKPYFIGIWKPIDNVMRIPLLFLLIFLSFQSYSQRSKKGKRIVEPYRIGTSINFKMNDAQIRQEDFGEVDYLVYTLNQEKESIKVFKIEIAGHASSSENNEDSISLARAESVYHYVKKAGLSTSIMISTKGYGTDYPCSEEEDDQYREFKNRRVLILILSDTVESYKDVYEGKNECDEF